LSLRSRLVLIVLGLLAIGLVASDVATASALRSYFLGRVDQELETTGAFTARLFTLGPPTRRAPNNLPPNVKPPARLEADVQAARISEDGHVVRTLEGPFTSTSDAFTVLPQSPLARARHGATVRFDVTSPSGHYRAIAEPIAGSTDVAVVVSPLRSVEATLTRLYGIEGIATAILLMLAGVLALWLVRVGLRPLVHIADTADAVAAGEVDRRVDVSGGYEVARLGHALNSAFDARAASEQTLREFISDASHELRTPLTSIRGYAELLRVGALHDPEEIARASARIEHEAARMGGLVDNLLSLARLDEGRPLDLADVDLTHLAADAISDARVVEPDRPISLIAQAPVNIVGDETALRQVLANLLSNAREHTPPRTTVEVRVAATPNGARLDIVDDGTGLRPDERVRVFDRFWRGANGTRSKDGSGLGLAIVAAVTEAHGGRAWAEPNDDRLRGAHFVVELPARPPG
jgi:two-component system, OmpR family, sensor kinase